MKLVFVPLIILSGTISIIAGSAAAYEQINVANGGTIKGTVTYNGDVPMRTILPTKDDKICGGLRKEALVKRGANNAVAESVVYLKSVKKGKAWPAGAPAPTLDNKSCRFIPQTSLIYINSQLIQLIN